MTKEAFPEANDDVESKKPSLAELSKLRTETVAETSSTIREIMKEQSK